MYLPNFTPPPIAARIAGPIRDNPNSSHQLASFYSAISSADFISYVG